MGIFSEPVRFLLYESLSSSFSPTYSFLPSSNYSTVKQGLICIYLGCECSHQCITRRAELRHVYEVTTPPNSHPPSNFSDLTKQKFIFHSLTQLQGSSGASADHVPQGPRCGRLHLDTNFHTHCSSGKAIQQIIHWLLYLSLQSHIISTDVQLAKLCHIITPDFKRELEIAGEQHQKLPQKHVNGWTTLPSWLSYLSRIVCDKGHTAIIITYMAIWDSSSSIYAVSSSTSQCYCPVGKPRSQNQLTRFYVSNSFGLCSSLFQHTVNNYPISTISFMQL